MEILVQELQYISPAPSATLKQALGYTEPHQHMLTEHALNRGPDDATRGRQVIPTS